MLAKGPAASPGSPKPRLIAVKEPGPDRRTISVHRRSRGHHGRHRHGSRHRRAGRRRPGPGPDGALPTTWPLASCSKVPPAATLRALDRRLRPTLAVLVDHHGLDRGGPDVEPAVSRDSIGIAGHLGQYGKRAQRRRSSRASSPAFVTAPVRAAGPRQLAQLAEVVHEPWTDQEPLKVYDGAELGRTPGRAKKPTSRW